MLRNLLFAVLVILPSAGNAFCIQYSGNDFSSQVNGAIDWLVCLHNEQNDAISDLTRTVNTNAQVFNDQMGEIAKLQAEMRSSEPLIEALQRMMADLIEENEALARRVEALEQAQ